MPHLPSRRRRVPADYAAHVEWGTEGNFATGAVNELTTLRFSSLLRRRSANPVLRQLLGAVIGQEAVHFAFYREMAALRLRESARAQRLTRWVMSHLWTPVGVASVAGRTRTA